MHKKPSHTNNSNKNHHTLTIRMKNHHILTIRMKNYSQTIFIKNHYTNIMRINIFVVINQINKHKAKICNHCTYTQIIIKKFS